MIKKGWFLLIFLCLLFVSVPGYAMPPPYMMSPINGTITSDFGWRTHPITGKQKFHSGVDIGGEYGMEVHAALAGTVSYAGWMSGYGNTVDIDHGDGVKTCYGHNESLKVQVGDHVEQGNIIAYCGSTGNSTGPHVHFEVMLNGEPVDPAFYCPTLGSGSVGNGMPMDGAGRYKEWELVNDFAKPIKEVMDGLTDSFTKGLKLLQDYVSKIFFILCLIDIAIGAMKKTLSSVEEDREGLAQWMIRRCFFYGFCLAMLYNWKDIVGNLSLYGFPQLGAVVTGDAEAAKLAVSDPTQIVQKGMSIVAPVLNASLPGKTNPIDFILSGGITLVNLLLALVLFGLFCLIGYYIALAYIQFYASVLFSFTAFPMAGVKYVRHFASNGVNGVIACSVNLMFFCFFAAALSQTMANIAVPAIVEKAEVTTYTGGAAGTGGSEVDAQLNDMGKAQIQQIYQELIALGYTPTAAWGICGNIAQESQGDPTSGMDEPVGPSGICQWMHERHTRLLSGEFGSDIWSIPYQVRFLDTEMQERGLKDKINSVGTAAEASDIFYSEFEGPDDGSDGKRARIAMELATGVVGMMQGTVRSIIHLGILLQLLLITLLFMFMADRVSKLVLNQFGTPGFRLYFEQGVFGRG